jgi:hypothetical protein
VRGGTDEGEAFRRCRQQLKYRVFFEPDTWLALVVERALQGADIE